MAFLVVYDVTNLSSFQNIKYWLDDILNQSSASMERMLLGNKCDMAGQRQILKGRGEAFAIQNGIKFLETSPNTNVNIDEAFLQIAESILDKLPKTTQQFPPRKESIIHFNDFSEEKPKKVTKTWKGCYKRIHK